MSSRAAAFLRTSGAVRQLFHQLRALAETVTPVTDGFTASHRAVLESLATHGPQTVPAMARARPVARQHIQVLVNELAALGLVETRANPAHKRSPLVALTGSGARRFQATVQAETKLLQSLRLSLSAGKLTALAGDLETLSEELGRWLADRQVPA
ncbi:MAG TPA: helix-turn-helix domain-containing protein [Polyangiaceae bacterium]|nr:helix-turn-helix domain-containing protein [Polyangiaceae bacterium]